MEPSQMIKSLTESKDYASLVSVPFLMRLMGILALSFAPIMYVGYVIRYKDFALLGSISEYYHSNMGDVFVGLLFAIGVFLIAYKGFSMLDAALSTLAGIAAICVALFPTACDEAYNCYNDLCPTEYCGTESTFHFISAGIFLTILMIFCFFIFTKNDDGERWRGNWYYRTYYGSGLLMLFSLLGIVVYSKLLSSPPEWLISLRPIFCLEALALSAFGMSWIVKGQWVKEHFEKLEREKSDISTITQ